MLIPSMVFVAELQTLLDTSITPVYIDYQLHNFRTGLEIKVSAVNKEKEYLPFFKNVFNMFRILDLEKKYC